jgi:hypothetical protein
LKAKALGYRIIDKDALKLLLKITLSSLAMAVYILNFKDMNIFTLIFSAVALYLALMAAIKGFQKTDLNMLKQLLQP